MTKEERESNMRQTKLKLLLYERGISIKRLAETTGIAQVTMYKKIHGDVDFTYTEVYLICKALDICNPFDVFAPKFNK